MQSRPAQVSAIASTDGFEAASDKQHGMAYQYQSPSTPVVCNDFSMPKLT